jgi:hypothetical protein
MSRNSRTSVSASLGEMRPAVSSAWILSSRREFGARCQALPARARPGIADQFQPFVPKLAWRRQQRSRQNTSAFFSFFLSAQHAKQSADGRCSVAECQRGSRMRFSIHSIFAAETGLVCDQGRNHSGAAGTLQPRSVSLDLSPYIVLRYTSPECCGCAGTLSTTCAMSRVLLVKVSAEQCPADAASH